MASIDLEDAYYAVSIHKESRKYLRFQFLDKTFEFVCLPFGLCTSPYIFTKILKPVVKSLRSKGFLSTIYLDDILCIDDSIEKCRDNVSETKELLLSLGFLINERKNSFEPSKKCKFLGFIIDSEKYCIELTKDKRENLINMINKILATKTCSIKEFAQLIGKLVAACPAIEYGFLYTKLKLFALIINNYNYDETMVVPKYIIPELNWWSCKLKNTVNQIKSGNYETTIYTDASTTGWGAVRDNDKIYGFWNESLKRKHINYLELLTVELALKKLAPDLKNCQILLRIDNTTAISYINKMGGVKYLKYHYLARRI